MSLGRWDAVRRCHWTLPNTRGCAVGLSKHSQSASTPTFPKEQNTVVVSMCPTPPPADVRAPCQRLSHSTVTALAEELQPLPFSYAIHFVEQPPAGSALDKME